MEKNSELSIPQIIDAGCDYLRLTVQPGKSLHPVFAAWEELIKEAESLGHERTKARFPRYSGYECGGLYVFHRPEDMMFEARGAIANRAAQVMRGVGFHGNTARSDFQATIYGAQEVCPHPEELYDDFRRHQTQSKAFAGVNMEFKRPAKTAHTLYVGSPDSDCFIRIYDAGAKHPDRYPAGAIRFEMQTANEVARHYYTGMGNAASVPCYSTSVVMGKLMSWDIHQPWYTSDPPIEAFSGWKPTNDEQSLAWIAKFVASTIRRLIKKGFAPQLCEILGVKSLELIEQPNPNAFLSPLYGSGYNIGVMSGSEPKSAPRKKIGLMAPVHSQAAQRKKLKKGGIE